jgi:hypothetical protein
LNKPNNFVDDHFARAIIATQECESKVSESYECKLSCGVWRLVLLSASLGARLTIVSSQSTALRLNLKIIRDPVSGGCGFSELVQRLISPYLLIAHKLGSEHKSQNGASA